MRTTVTLDPDVEAKLRSVAHERGQSFKVTLNDAVRAGLVRSSGSALRYSAPSRPMGVRPGVGLDGALRLASDLEDSETVRKLHLRK
jgi:hypothetical protein